MARDWLKTLWLASYKGVSFWTERDEEEGGRRIVVHKFPNRDIPYLEDLGEDQRDFDVTAYLASDSADSDAGQLIATCATRGPGILVLPTHGPLLVRCLTWKRSRDKDRHGYIAFTLKFVREGASSALVSTELLANLVFIAAEQLAVAAAAAFVGAVKVERQAEFVVAAASEGARDAVAVFEGVRISEPVDPNASAAQRDQIQSLFDAIPDLVDDRATIGTVPARTIAIARALGDAMPAEAALRAFESVAMSYRASDLGTYPTPSRLVAALNAAAAARLLRLAALAAYAEAVARTMPADRPAGITLRANVAEYFEAELVDLPAAEIDLYHAIAAIRDAAIDYLSRSIIDLAPVVQVAANLSMPSLFWAWRMYQDPNRALELVARNRVAHPSFMPAEFEALAR